LGAVLLSDEVVRGVSRWAGHRRDGFARTLWLRAHRHRTQPRRAAPAATRPRRGVDHARTARHPDARRAPPLRAAHHRDTGYSWDAKNGKVRRIPITETIAALLAEKYPQNSVQEDEAAEAASCARTGGRQEARTPDLRVANAALSQLS